MSTQTVEKRPRLVPAPVFSSRTAAVDVLPSLAVLGAGQTAGDRTCPRCGAVCPAALPDPSGAGLVLLERSCGLYELFAVHQDDAWTVRPVEDREQGLPFFNRVTAHECATDSGLRCCTPGHQDQVARLFPGGPFCGTCVPSRKDH